MTTLLECGFIVGLLGLIEHKVNDGNWISIGEKVCHGKMALILIFLFFCKLRTRTFTPIKPDFILPI